MKSSPKYWGALLFDDALRAQLAQFLNGFSRDTELRIWLQIMLRDGLYELSYPCDPSSGFEQALAIVRDGTLLGADPNGGVYTSQHDHPGSDGRCIFVIDCQMPPHSQLITGKRSGASGDTAVICGAIDADRDHQTVTLLVDGAPVDVEVTYLGPLKSEPTRAMKCA